MGGLTIASLVLPAGNLVDQGSFKELIRDFLLQLAEKMQDLRVNLQHLGVLSAVVIVNCFFYEGLKAILQVALAVLDTNMEQLLGWSDKGKAMTLVGR
ncbi:TBC1 domain member 9B [Saguinus oedipus]|uniref:TBC1 domain member 9B n=1 Tax=Saguinus oedipus TaxID=9490 RepID=A0ABQ9W4E4_SAGOE|nr:TBC1 domain member 9B [Saguinus oedipus]